MKKSTVKIYSTPTCVYCTMAKKFFKDNKVDFQEIDVSKDREAAMEMVEKTGQMGVPVIDIDGKMIIGFNMGEIKAALGME